MGLRRFEVALQAGIVKDHEGSQERIDQISKGKAQRIVTGTKREFKRLERVDKNYKLR